MCFKNSDFILSFEWFGQNISVIQMPFEDYLNDAFLFDFPLK